MKLYEVLLRKVGLWNEPSNPIVGSSARSSGVPATSEESKIYNPIGCRVGGVVKIDSLDFREYRFGVTEIEQSMIVMNGKNHQMVDYVLLARPIGQPDFECVLRIIPDNNNRSACSHRAVLLSLYDSMEFNEGLIEVCKSDEKKFVIDDDKCDDDVTNDEHFEYWRVNDVGTSYIANVTSLTDENRDGKVDESEVSSRQVEFWDYSRMTDVDGVEVEEFVFVEMNKETGWIDIWRGTEVNPERIEVF